METSQEMSVPWLAQRLGCTITRAQSLVRSGRIAGWKTATGWVTTEAALEAYLHRRTSQNGQLRVATSN